MTRSFASTPRGLRCWPLLAALLAPACAPGASAPGPEPAAPRVLFVAVDGLEWNVLLPLLRAGRLPEIEALMGRGRYGLLETFEPTLSPAIWTSIATGKDVAGHGIGGFRYDDPDHPGQQLLYTNADRKTKAFWNILSDYHRTVDLVGWFLTFPVEPVNGVMVAQTSTLSADDFVVERRPKKGVFLPGIEGQVWPPDRQEQMAGIFYAAQEGLPSLDASIFGSFPNPPGEFERSVWERSQWALRADATYEAMTAALIREGPADVTAVYLGGADVLAHPFWRYMQPEGFAMPPDPPQLENFGRVIPDYYVYLDAVVGRLLRAFPEEPTVILASDHGMHAVNRRSVFKVDGTKHERVSGGHGDAPAGVLIAAGRGFRGPDPTAPPLRSLTRASLRTVGTVYDVTPTLLALLDVPAGEDMRGGALVDLIDQRWLAAHPVRTVPTHDTPEWLGSRPEVPPIEGAVEERLEQLRELGYID